MPQGRPTSRRAFLLGATPGLVLAPRAADAQSTHAPPSLRVRADRVVE